MQIRPRYWVCCFAVGATLLATGGRSAAADASEYWDTSIPAVDAERFIHSAAAYRGNLVVGGSFIVAGEVQANGIATWDGAQWHAMNGGVVRGFYDKVFTMAVSGDYLYVGGAFTNAGDVQARSIARWDGQKWLPLGSGVDGIVTCSAVHGSNLIVAGSFNTASGLSTTNIARWDGTNWHSLGAGLPGEAVDAVAASEDAVYAGGRIDGFYENGEPSYLVKWDGRQWVTMGIRSRGVGKLLWTTQGLLAGGRFFVGAGQSLHRVVLWNGSEWSSLQSGLPATYQTDCFGEVRGQLLLAASGDLGSGLWTGNVMAWSQGQWNNLGGPFERAGTGGGISAITSNGTQLFAGGRFLIASGKPATNIASWHFPRTLKAAHTGGQLALSWPGPETNSVLEVAANLAAPSWEPVTTAPVLSNGRLTVTNAVAGGTEFYRLRSP